MREVWAETRRADPGDLLLALLATAATYVLRALRWQYLLAPLGHAIVAARSGEEAIARAKEREFALALVDVTMRGMDGFETVSRLRRIESFRVTPVVFVTGYADSVSAIRAVYKQVLER